MKKHSHLIYSLVSFILSAMSLSNIYAQTDTTESYLQNAHFENSLNYNKIMNTEEVSSWMNIKNGALWKDNNGNSVQAHGAGFLQVGDKWYMVGEDRTSWNSGVNLYSSSDLQQWKFEKKIIPPTAYSSNRFIERPKLMRCPSTGKFVIWCHYEGDSYGASEAASFVCDSVNGLYSFHWGGRPLGIKSRDSNVFVDNDGTGYFVSTTDDNKNLTLFKLSNDYLDVIDKYRLTAFDGQQREAPAIIRIGNTYFLISSKCTGWDPNQATISHSTSLTGGWSNQSNIGNNITFDTQAASILTIKGTQVTTYLYVGDRWQDPGLAESKTIIFPISFNGTTCSFAYRQQFDLNFSTGQWRETNTSTSRISKTNWKIRAFSSQEINSENGTAANAIDGNLNTIWHTQYSGTTAPAPHSIEVDMGQEYAVSGFLCTQRMNTGSSNGLTREFMFYVSTDGNNWSAVAGGTWLPYSTEIYFKPIQARYFRFVALSGTYTSLAELDMLQNTSDYFTEKKISPIYKINSSSTFLSDQIITNQGVDILLSPSTSSNGTWAWNLHNNIMKTSRECTLSNIAPFDSGAYRVMFLDQYMSVNSLDYHVVVNKSIITARKKIDYLIARAKAVYNIYMEGSANLQKQIDNATTMRASSYSIIQKDSIAEVLKNEITSYIMKNIAIRNDKTNLIRTPNNFASNIPFGWNGTMPTSVGNGCGEFFDTTFIFSQTLKNLENGYYLVGVQSIYRSGSNDKGAGYLNANEGRNVELYAGNKSTNVESLYSLPYTSTGNLNGFCNSLNNIASVFNEDENNYGNWLVAEVTSDTLAFGLRKTTTINSDWCAFNNFRLYYLGNENILGIDTPIASSSINFLNHILQVNTLKAEQINIYSVDGLLQRSISKPAEAIQIPLNDVKSKILIIHGASGWMIKVIND